MNCASLALHNTMVVVGDEAIEIGGIESGVSKIIEIPQQDSIRVIFTLGQEREDWLGTDILPIQDTIYIDDNTETFEVAISL